MKLISPDYYTSFSCIADKCRHSCCIGWEIDIDGDTLDLYSSIGGDFSKRLADNISNDACPHFVLREHDRCPFLNENGLCDIITELGDGALCDICADHPRYQNYFDDRVEMGLGLCCEEAARLILSKKDKAVLINAETGNEAVLFPERQKVLDILQDRSLPFSERLLALHPNKCKDYSALYYSLERLDSEWDKYIELLKSDTDDTLPEWDMVFEQLAVYFILRHTAENFHDGVLFSVHAVYIIRNICAALKKKNSFLAFSEILDICRMYSSEIEYSDENVVKIINNIKN